MCSLPASIGFYGFASGTGVPTYDIDVTYASGVTCRVSASAGLLALPTGLAPTGTGVSGTPVFSWTPPNPLPAGPQYTVSVTDEAVPPNTLWQYVLPSSNATSVAYNADSSAQQSVLTSGQPYVLTVYVQDENDNSSSTSVQFTVQ